MNLLLALLRVFLLEPLDPPFSVDDLLRSRKEWMAVRADIDVNSGNGRTGLDNGPTGTVDRRFLVFGMDTLFHNTLSIEQCL